MTAKVPEEIEAKWRTYEDRQRGLLLLTLELAVPMWIERVASMAPEGRQARAAELVDMVASQGDKVLYLTPRTKREPTSTADVFNALAEALAIMAYAPGGVEFCGRRWVAGDQQEVA